MRRIILAAGLLALAAPAYAQGIVWIVPPPPPPPSPYLEPWQQPAPQRARPCVIVGQYLRCN